MIWFTRWWWAYLLAPRTGRKYSWLRTILCRLHGHPAGVIWYNTCGQEPDMSCKGCGDDLG